MSPGNCLEICLVGFVDALLLLKSTPYICHCHIFGVHLCVNNFLICNATFFTMSKNHVPLADISVII